MKNVHILPTDNPSKLRYFDGKLELMYLIPKKSDITFQNIYITCDEEIKDGDWFLEDDIENLIFQRRNSKVYSLPDSAKKIILTTDQDLDGVQKIDDEFLEWFIKNPSCEMVEVTSDIRAFDNENREVDFAILKEDYIKIVYTIIIPQEESKQETLEDTAKKFTENLYYKVGDPDEFNGEPLAVYDAFIAGANCQSERMYSEEEVISLLNDFAQHLIFNKNSSLNIIDWFEQFKKK